MNDLYEPILKEIICLLPKEIICIYKLINKKWHRLIKELNIISEGTITYLAEKGYIDVLLWIYPFNKRQYFCFELNENNYSTFLLFYSKGYNYEYAVDGICKYGNKNDFQYYILSQKDNELLNLAVIQCIKNNRLDYLKYMKKMTGILNHPIESWYNLCHIQAKVTSNKKSFNTYIKSAAYYGKLEVLKWLKSIGYNFDDSLNYACIGGNLETVKYLERFDTYDNLSFSYALKSKNVELLNYLHSKPLRYHTLALYDFCQDSDAISIIDWMVNKGYRLLHSAYGHAAEKSHIHILNHLKNNNFPIRNTLVHGAILSNNKKVLDWAKENNSPFNIQQNKNTCILYGLQNSLEWLVDNINDDYSDILDCAIRLNKLNIAKWAFDRGFKSNKSYKRQDITDDFLCRREMMIEFLIKIGIFVDE